MDESLIKPDIMLVTKNVMVPVARPPSDGKFFLNPFSSKKKTKIVKSRKCRTLPKVEDICNTSRHRRDKSNETTICSNDYLDFNCNSSVHVGGETDKYICNQEIVIKDNRVRECSKEQSKSNSYLSNRRQNLLSESFPMTIEREDEHRKSLLPRPSRRLLSNPKNTDVTTKKKDALVLEKSEENHVECVRNENEEPEVLGYKIKQRHRKISLPKTSKSLTSNAKNDQIKEEKNVALSLEKFEENVAQSLPDEIKVISSQIKTDSSAISIPELHICISDNISLKPASAVEKEETKSIAEKKCEIKYSWQDLDNWVPPSQKKKLARGTKKLENSSSDCEIKYSWQVIGTGAQTSDYLLNDFLSYGQIRANEEIGAKNYPCSVKYSWQIIGTATQVCFSNSGKDSLENDEEYWKGNILTPCKRSLDCNALKNDFKKIGKRKILYNEGTQTFAEKSHQTDMTDCRAKYSWQNLTKTYLASNNLP